jgi:hypothetical protein
VPRDMVTSNHYTATWPQSPFVAQPVLVRKDEHQVRRLLGRQLSHTRPGAATQQWQLTDSRFAAALHDLRPGPRPGRCRGSDRDPATQLSPPRTRAAAAPRWLLT